MTGRAWLRRAGHGRLASGAVVTWSVAEGSRGRRWRWTLVDETGLRHVGLLELDREGRFARLELDGPAAMLTLHPDPSAGDVAHGNAVTGRGVQPISVPWALHDGVAIDGDPFGTALVDGQGARHGVVIRLDGPDVTPGDPSTVARVAIDERGIPRLGDGVEWALEVSD